MYIGRISAEDIPGMAELVQNIIQDTDYYSSEAKEAEKNKFSVENLQSLIKNDNSIFLAAKEDDKLIGFIYGFFDCGTFWADWIGVLKENRRKGVALGLMRELEMILGDTKTRKVWCDTRSDNKESNAMLKKLGFERAAHLKEHWYGQDYYLWEKFL